MSTQSIKNICILLMLLFSAQTYAEEGATTVRWDESKPKMDIKLKELSGVVEFDSDIKRYARHHFSEMYHTPTNTLVSPDNEKMKHVGFLNFFRVLISGGYLTELRAESPTVKKEKDGVTLTYSPTIRRQAKVTVRFTFKQPNIIDMDLAVEPLTHYNGFEVLLSAYLANGFISGAYVADKEFRKQPGPMLPEQIRIVDQPMIHGVWPFFQETKLEPIYSLMAVIKKAVFSGGWRLDDVMQCRWHFLVKVSLMLY
ncbi:hypothetical protein [Colwellia piezophila]|uniref:hypothetical protein n=1 Tax=Colwellia piezophila TaxID=211668 RepID=UPI00035CE497|nr:hypothetical protein [Colwellia piezophila]